MNIQHRLLGTECCHVCWSLVANVDFDPRIGRFHHHLVCDEGRCLCHCRSSGSSENDCSDCGNLKSQCSLPISQVFLIQCSCPSPTLGRRRGRSREVYLEDVRCLKRVI